MVRQIGETMTYAEAYYYFTLSKPEFFPEGVWHKVTNALEEMIRVESGILQLTPTTED